MNNTGRWSRIATNGMKVHHCGPQTVVTKQGDKTSNSIPSWILIELSAMPP